MVRDQVLDRLKSKRDQAYQAKQLAFERYKEIRDRTSMAHDEMNAAWQERTAARERMNAEFEARKSAYESRDEIWGEYQRIRNRNNYRIEDLRRYADSEHEAMKESFDRASAAYEYGDRSEAPIYSAEGREHKENRNAANEEIKSLIQEIRTAKEYAESHAPRVSSEAFNQAKAEFEAAKERHVKAQTRFKELKAERDHLKAEFDRAKEEFFRIKAEFDQRLELLKAERTLHRSDEEKAIAIATDKFGEKPAKVRRRKDGKMDVFFSSSGNYGDSVGHGHVVIDVDGNVIYMRDEWQDKSQGQYLIDSSKEDHTRI